MTKLGFTWYPENWWSSDAFYDLDPNIERYVYLECLWFMYKNNGYMILTREKLEQRLRMQISEQTWQKITQRFTKTEKGLTHESVNKRLKKATTSRANGTKGGRPRNNNNPENPDIKPRQEPERERERERENKSEREEEQITYGDKSPMQLKVKKVYAHDKIKIINNLELYFIAMGQLDQLAEAGYTAFDGFMKSRPGKIFNDDGHLYNDFLDYCKKQSPPRTLGTNNESVLNQLPYELEI